jgi:hypothetical protein
LGAAVGARWGGWLLGMDGRGSQHPGDWMSPGCEYRSGPFAARRLKRGFGVFRCCGGMAWVMVLAACRAVWGRTLV